MEEKWTVDKLGDSNWSTWKFQMRHLLLAKGLWGHVDGSDVLAGEASDAVRAEFKQKAERAFSTIVMAVSTPRLYLVTSCTKPKEVWDKLCEHFECESLANKLYLKKRYFRTEMKEGTSMEQHLKEMKETSDRLAAIGAPISEEDQVVTLLGSLPSSYSALVTTLECRIDDVKLSYVQQALLHEERKVRERSRCEERSRRDQPDNSALVGRRVVKCYGCGEPGHIRRFCPKKVNAGPTHKANTAEGNPADGEGAFAASVDSLRFSQSEQWLVDSGASSHMTRQKELFMNYVEFEKPEKVGLGDGKTVEAVGMGDIRMQMFFGENDPQRATLYRVLYVPKLACNLFSVRAAASKGNTVKFGMSSCWIRDAEGKLRGKGACTRREIVSAGLSASPS